MIYVCVHELFDIKKNHSITLNSVFNYNKKVNQLQELKPVVLVRLQYHKLAHTFIELLTVGKILSTENDEKICTSEQLYVVLFQEPLSTGI